MKVRRLFHLQRPPGSVATACSQNAPPRCSCKVAAAVKDGICKRERTYSHTGGGETLETRGRSTGERMAARQAAHQAHMQAAVQRAVASHARAQQQAF